MYLEENPNKYTELVEMYKVMRWEDYTNGDWQKCIVNLRGKIDQLDVHATLAQGISDNLSVKRYPDNPPLIINHYIVQSLEFFMEVKSRRGDVNNW